MFSSFFRFSSRFSVSAFVVSCLAFSHHTACFGSRGDRSGTDFQNFSFSLSQPMMQSGLSNFLNLSWRNFGIWAIGVLVVGCIITFVIAQYMNSSGDDYDSPQTLTSAGDDSDE